nr:cysteine-rich KTR domain-containing protein [uncultured Sellimonas sp.]
MDKQEWVLCPICKNKTRIKIRYDTVLENFPLFCPKCKQETLISMKQLTMSVVREPDAQTQSR